MCLLANELGIFARFRTKTVIEVCDGNGKVQGRSNAIDRREQEHRIDAATDGEQDRFAAKKDLVRPESFAESLGKRADEIAFFSSFSHRDAEGTEREGCSS